MTRKPSCMISCSHSFPDGGAEALVGRHGAMKPGGSGREYSDMGRWDRRRLRGGQQNRGSGGPRNSLSDPSLSTLPCRARIANRRCLQGIGVAIMVRSKLPWRRKCMPLYYMDPTIEEISLSWSSIENTACLIFLAVAFATVAAKPGNLPPRYEGVARRLRDTNNAQLVGQFTDIVF